MAGERILVVDDGADMRDFVVNYVIKPNGYEAIEAPDGMAALKLIMDSPPDLIILDLQMPRLDGIGLLRRMREEGIHIPVVLMTFFGSEEIAIEVFRLGVRDYVIKPFTDDELLAAIEKALVETRLRQAKELIQERLTRANDRCAAQLANYRVLLTIGHELDGLYEDREQYTVDLVRLASRCEGVASSALLSVTNHSDDITMHLNFGSHQSHYETIFEALRSGEIHTKWNKYAETTCVVCPISDGLALSVTVYGDVPSDHVMMMLRGIRGFLRMKNSAK